MSTAARILDRWRSAGHQGDSLRKFAATKQTNITRSFHGAWGTADAEVRFDLPLFLARSRELEQNNKYVRGWLNAQINNVLGPSGFTFQMKVRRSEAFGDNSTGELDTQANDIIETFCKKAWNRRNYSVTRNISRREADQIILTRALVDGEIFVRTFTGFGNDTGIARQLIESDVCDINYNEPVLPNGNQVRMGIELDQFGAPQAYHFLKRPLNDYQQRADPRDLRERVPASQVRHIFFPTRPGQTRGFPMCAAAMLQLRMLDMFEEAALINAKIGASRNLFYTKQLPTGWSPADGSPYPNDEGAIPDELREGEALELPVGVEPRMLDTRFPDGEIEPFVRWSLHGISAALGVSYMTLSGDMSRANFSSLRAGLNEERSGYARFQRALIENNNEPDFEQALAWGLATQRIKLPPGKFDKFNKPEFTGRRWPSVNPLQDAQADVLEINNLLKSRSEVIRSRGRDPEEVLGEIVADKALADKHGLKAIDEAKANPEKEQEDKPEAEEE